MSIRIGTPTDVLDGTAQCALGVADQKVLFALLPSMSVEAVITDPPYGRDAFLCYTDCYRGAARTLKPHGDLLMIMGHYQLDPFDTLDDIKHPDMVYRWTLAMIQREGSYARLVNGHRNIAVTWKPIGWWYKRGPKPKNYAGVVDSYDNRPPQKGHPWEQSPDWANFCIDHLYYDSGVIVDPMVGSGTLAVEALKRGYRVIAGDIDPDAVKMTEERIRDALPVV